MKKTALRAAFGSALFLFLLFPVRAAAPTSLGTFDSWRTFLYYEGKDPFCYMALIAAPPPQRDASPERGNVVLMIAHNPAISSFDIVSYAPGARFKSNSDVEVEVEGRKFSLFSKGAAAWSEDPAIDKALTLALRKAERAVIRGVTAQNTRIADEVDLTGSNAAYKAISKACSVTVR